MTTPASDDAAVSAGEGTRRLVALIREARRILLFTGAGISTGSGIPDFRGPGGIWSRRRPVYYQEFLESHAARVEHWEYKLESWQAFRDARPNAVHTAAAELEAAGKVEAVVTQNIDGLHSRAGTAPERLVEIHGTNSAVECLDCGAREAPDRHYADFARTRAPPRCACGGLLKTATISFGQSLREADLRRAFAAAAAADLAIALGSTLSVQPAASVPLAAAGRGVPYVVINRGATDHDGHEALTLRISGDVGELFPRAVREALSEGESAVR